jgi:hypothetical protein
MGVMSTEAIKAAIRSLRVQLAVLAILLTLLLVFPSRAQRMDAQTSAGTGTDARCVSNLKRIHAMIELYVHHSGGGLGFPTSLEKINLMTRDKSLFVCPAEVPVTAARKKYSFKTSYEIVNDPLKPDLKKTPPDRVAIVAEKRAKHDGKRFVLFYDGSVRAFDEAKFDKLKSNSFIDIQTVEKNR